MAEKARRHLLQMPLVSVRIGNPAKGNSFTILIEHCHGVDYSKISLVLDGFLSPCANQNPQGLEKGCVKMLLTLATSDREREVMRYAIFKASGMSATRARRQYGFECMVEHSARVQEAIVETQRIHESVEDNAKIQAKALSASFGIEQSSSSSDETDLDEEQVSTSLDELSPSFLDLCKRTLAQSNYNWFELQEVLEAELGCDSGEVLKRLQSDLLTLSFTKCQMNLITVKGGIHGCTK